MQVTSVIRLTRCAAENLPTRVFRRLLTSNRQKQSYHQGPRLAVERQESLPKDPEVLVRSVHEKERNAFREALNMRDFTKAYQIYEEQRGLPILSGAEVTSLVQLIFADASLRRHSNYEFPESIEEVFWTIVRDVKDRKVAGQTLLWAYALDVLVVWDRLTEAQDLWTFLQQLPNRTSVAKNDAHCIDSRVYGSAIRLYTALNDMPSVTKLYKEALKERNLQSSLMIEQAYIAALFQNKRIGEAYKAMDRTIREQRGALRPKFFTSMICLALDADAIGVASEIFMKSCKVKMPPSRGVVTRLLKGLARIHSDPLGSVMTLFKHYQAVTNGKIPVEHVNCVLDAMFASIQDNVSKSEILGRVHELLSEMNKNGVQASATTVNILLKGYTSLEEHALVDGLLSQAQLDENSFRAILKALAQSPSDTAFGRVKQCWQAFEDFRQRTSSGITARDLHMLMRAAFATDVESARAWIPELMAERALEIDVEAQTKLQDELQCHLDGTFVHTKSKYDKSWRPSSPIENTREILVSDSDHGPAHQVHVDVA